MNGSNNTSSIFHRFGIIHWGGHARCCL